MAVRLLDAGGMGPIGVFLGTKWGKAGCSPISIRSKNWGNVPSVPDFPEKAGFSKLEDSAFGWRSGLPLRFKRSRNPPL
jgi:hypothetical protein